LKRFEPSAALNAWNDWNRLLFKLNDMPDVPWQKVTACSWHRSFLEGPFHSQKVSRIHSDKGLNDLNVAKRLNDWNGFR
jgi:hypothetical protein